MKIKIVPLTIAAAISAALLFGGWTAYRHLGVEKPLDRVAASLPGVESASAKWTSGQVTVDVKLDQHANLSEIYRKLKENGAGQVGGKKLELRVDSESSELLEKAWNYSLFDVAEAMETRHYSGIRAAMEKLSEKFPGVKASADMDDDNVYIRLVYGNKAKFVVLPRQPASMGVWPNA